jgi:hypothetical protein
MRFGLVRIHEAAAGAKVGETGRSGCNEVALNNKKASPLREKLLVGFPRFFGSSDFANVHGIDTLAAFLRFELYPVILLHRGPVQARYVHEEVFFRLVVGHEAISFGFVEKFNDAGFHAKNKNGKGKNRPGKGCGKA